MPRWLLVCLLLLAACGQPQDEAHVLIEQTRTAHGVSVLDRAEVSFRFRDAAFTLRREDGRYRYTRATTDSLGRALRETLDNDGFRVTADGQPVALTDSAEAARIVPVNAVPYFALLPYNLADPAVQPRILGADTIGGEPYDVVEVTFREEGGGEDFEDRFVYWLHADRHTMDFLAYRFHTGEGGTRFREATNVRTVGGVRFADYLNYTADDSTTGTPFAPLERYPRLLGTDSLRPVSVVALDSVRVTPL